MVHGGPKNLEFHEPSWSLISDPADDLGQLAFCLFFTAVSAFFKKYLI